MSAPIGVIPWIAAMAVLACDVAVIFIFEQIFIDEHPFVRIQRLHFSASARTFGLDSVYRRLLLSQCSSNLHQFFGAGVAVAAFAFRCWNRAGRFHHLMDFFLDILFLGIILLFPIFCSSGLQTQGFSSFVIYLSKACAKSEGSEKVLHFIE